MVSKRVNVPSLQVNIFWDTFTIFLRCSVFFFFGQKTDLSPRNGEPFSAVLHRS